MTISFYKTADDPKKLNKTFTNVGSGEATLSATVNNTDDTITLLSPAFIVASNSAYFTATHIYVNDLGKRYYYINNITLMTGGKLLISCSVDVLATYATAISSCVGTAIRSESAGINKIPDSKYPVDPCKFVLDALNYPRTPFSRTPTSPYILTTIGGYDNE